MWYIRDLASNDLHGPFMQRYFAHVYAAKFTTDYRIVSDRVVQNLFGSTVLQLVPIEDRGYVAQS